MRALIALGLVLQAVPARWSRSSVEAIVTAPLPSGQRSLSLKSSAGDLQAIWLHQGDQDHLAIRDPLGPPVAILRSDGQRLGMELLGKPEVVASGSEVVKIATEDGLDLPDVARLLAGRLPARTPLERVTGGWRARRGQFEARLDVDGTLRWARWRGVELADGTLSFAGQRVQIELGPLREREFPEHAFNVGSARQVSIEQVFARWIQRSL